MAEFIEREAALLSLTPIVKRASERNRNIYSAVKQCVEAINWTPAADVAPVRHGRWIDISDIDHRSKSCSSCGFNATELLAKRCNYCPNCGAYMKEVKTD